MKRSGYLSKSPIPLDGEERRGKVKAVLSIRGLKHLLRRSRSEEGNSLVEFALVAVLFFFLIFAIFDFGHLFFIRAEVDSAMQEAARFASTGNHVPFPAGAPTPLSRVNSIIFILDAEVPGVNISNIQISNALGSTDAAGNPDAGAPRDSMTLTATVNIPLMTPMIAALFPGGKYTFTTSVTVKNENFPPGETD